MKTKIYLITICLASFLMVACMGGGGETLKLKIGDKERSLNSKTSWFARGDSDKNSLTYFTIMNYERNAKDTYSTTNELKSDDQMKVTFILQGKEGSDKKSPIRTGDYLVRKSATDNFDNLQSATIVFFDQSSHFSEGSEGKINIKSVSDEKISGTIDLKLKDGDFIKGNFTAKRVDM